MARNIRAAVEPPAVAGTVAGALAAVALVLGWRGGDWPAQLLRVDLAERAGVAMWNNLWFAGHHTPGYGIVFPTLAAASSVEAVALLSCVGAAAAFAALVRGSAGRRADVAAWLFAAGTVVNVAVGRLTFALGLAMAVGALAALRARRGVLGTVLVALTAPASPVAGVALGLALTAWAWHERRLRLLVLAAVAVAPVALAGALFPQGGQFPFRAGALAWSLAVAGLVAAASQARVVRLGAALYAAGCLATFVVPNPLGANATRLGMFVAAPIVVLTANRRARRLLAVAVPVLLWWQWSPAIDGMVRAGRDPSSVAAYHEPLVAAVRELGGAAARVEVVPTQRHWEAVHVARHVPLARGWERQLDMGRNPIFYRPGLDAETYRRWLHDHGVGFVALADAALDPAGVQEAALLRGGLPYLEPVWRDEHWWLWRVVGSEPLVEGPARLVRVDPAAVVLDVDGPGDVLVRVRTSSHWSLDVPGCVLPSADGWTVVRTAGAGRVTLRAVLAPGTANCHGDLAPQREITMTERGQPSAASAAS